MGAVAIAIHGGEVLVDEADAHLVEGRDWFVHHAESGIRYAVSKRERLHRLIVSPASGQFVDHANGNGLDNRRENLRVCTHSQNMQNRKPSSARTSRFKGVTVLSRNCRKPYQVRIKAHGECVHIGSFLTEKAAALAYDRAARIFHGKFAKTNKDLGLL